MSDYYDGARLLALKDLDGKTPEIYMCTTNRTAGKTTYFSKYLMDEFLAGNGKFALLYRYDYETADAGEKFFKDIGPMFFPDLEMTSAPRSKGVFVELFVNGNSCGYAIALNKADTLKKYSQFLSDVNRILFDEFQSESGHYCPQEIRKFISIHTSIARGQGKQYRYVPVYMCGNTVSVINPYYGEFGVSARLRKDTKFLRGNGWVLEQGFNDTASKAQLSSAFNRAFAGNDYVAYSAQNVYLNDSEAFIEKPRGTGKYICTIKFEGREYALREFETEGIIYCDDRPDQTFPVRYVVTTEDHNVNYLMLRKNNVFFGNLRFYFERGIFRFKDMRCKDAIMRVLCYL